MTAFTEISVHELSETIRNERRKANLTQNELADRSGISKMTISRIERGVNNPEILTIMKLLEAILGDQSDGVILSFDSSQGEK